jgi:hypothetical protein
MSVTASKAVVRLDELTGMAKLSCQRLASELTGVVDGVLLAHVTPHRFQLKPNGRDGVPTSPELLAVEVPLFPLQARYRKKVPDTIWLLTS